MTNDKSLANLGWQPCFQQQLSIEEWDQVVPARIVEQHKSELEVSTGKGTQILPITHSMPDLTVAVHCW